MKRQHYDMKYWNWGPTTIWHNIESVAFFSSSKSLHPTLDPHLFFAGPDPAVFLNAVLDPVGFLSADPYPAS